MKNKILKELKKRIRRAERQKKLSQCWKFSKARNAAIQSYVDEIDTYKEIRKFVNSL